MKVITVCGSFKYIDEMIKVSEKLCLEGNCVLSPMYPINGKKYSDEDKKILGQMHLERIKLSDSIFVINVDNYIGESTKKEIEFAKSLGKEIVYYKDIN